MLFCKLQGLPKYATIPSLGLSNKIVLQNFENDSDDSLDSLHRPFEEDLVQNTLWPETHKLYGHGFEIYSLAASRGGALLASANRSTNSENSKIIIWDTKSAKELQRLSGHNLTVTDLKFSPDNNYLLSTSRDRSWCTFQNTGVDSTPFVFESRSEKQTSPHTRIIWACDWTHDSKMFATTSREGVVAVWSKTDKWTLFTKTVLKNESVTAVSFCHKFYKDKDGEYLLAVGLESGQILFYTLSDALKLIFTVDHEYVFKFSPYFS